jgi:hypothetical protein
MTEPQALPDRKGQQVLMGHKVLRAPKAWLARKAQLEQMGHKALRELQDRLVLRVPKVPLVCKV